MGKKSATPAVLEGKVELVDPRSGKPTRRVKGVLALHAGPPVRLALKVQGKAQEIVLEAPFWVVQHPSQLRVTREGKEGGECLLIVPAAVGPTLDQWQSKINETLAQTSNPQRAKRDERALHIVCPDGRVLPVPLASPGGAAATVDSVLDVVVNRSLKEVPSRFLLCWASQGKHCAEWLVTDGQPSDTNPAALGTWGGELLYLLPKKIDIVPALTEWLDKLGQPNAYHILNKWSADSSSSAQQLVALASQLLRMNEASIATLYDAVSHPPALQLLSHRLHGFDEAVEISPHRRTTRFVRITNNLQRPVLLRVEHAMPGLKDGFQLHCHPRVLPCPEGQSRTVRLDFSCTNDATLPHRGPQVYFLNFSYSEISRSGVLRSTGKELPFVVPFNVRYRDAGRPRPCAQEGDFTTLASQPLQEIVGILDNSTVETITGPSRELYARRILRLAPNNVELVKKEIKTLDSMRHPNLSYVAKYGVEGSGRVVVLTPYFKPMLTLREWLFSSTQLSVPLRIKVAIDVMTGIKHLHHFESFVPDFRPDSVAVISSEFDPKRVDGSVFYANARLIDLGSLKGMSPLTSVRERPWDSMPYIAPEMVPFGDSRLSSPQADVYSFSMILYMLATRVSPFSETRAEWCTVGNLCDAIVNNSLRPSLLLVPKDWPRPLVALMQQCWSQQPGQRPVDDTILDALHASLYPYIISTDEWKAVKFLEPREDPEDDAAPVLSATSPQPQSPPVPQKATATPAAPTGTSTMPLPHRESIRPTILPQNGPSTYSSFTIRGLPNGLQQQPNPQPASSPTIQLAVSRSSFILANSVGVGSAASSPAVASLEQPQVFPESLQFEVVQPASALPIERPFLESPSQPSTLPQVVVPAEALEQPELMASAGSEPSSEASSGTASSRASDGDQVPLEQVLQPTKEDERPELMVDGRAAPADLKRAESGSESSGESCSSNSSEADGSSPAEAIVARMAEALESAPPATPLSPTAQMRITEAVESPLASRHYSGDGDDSNNSNPMRSKFAGAPSLGNSVIVRVVTSKGATPTASVRIARTCVSASQFFEAVKMCMKTHVPSDATLSYAESGEAITDEFLTGNLLAMKSPMEVLLNLSVSTTVTVTLPEQDRMGVLSISPGVTTASSLIEQTKRELGWAVRGAQLVLCSGGLALDASSPVYSGQTYAIADVSKGEVTVRQAMTGLTSRFLVSTVPTAAHLIALLGHGGHLLSLSEIALDPSEKLFCDTYLTYYPPGCGEVVEITVITPNGKDVVGVTERTLCGRLVPTILRRTATVVPDGRQVQLFDDVDRCNLADEVPVLEATGRTFTITVT